MRIRRIRTLTLAAGLVLALTVAWLIGLSTLKAIPSFDPLLWTLQISGLIVFIGGALIALWNLRIVLQEKRGWFRTLWAVLVLLAMLLALYLAWTFGLIAMTVNY